MFRILFHTPEIPGNTGNAIRLAAITGAELHLVEPLGFDFSDAKLRRAGLDYHDLAVVTVHKDIEAAWEALQPERVFAYTSDGETSYTDIDYRPGDVLMFGPESARGQCPSGIEYRSIEDVFRTIDRTPAGRWLVNRMLAVTTK